MMIPNSSLQRTWCTTQHVGGDAHLLEDDQRIDSPGQNQQGRRGVEELMRCCRRETMQGLGATWASPQQVNSSSAGIVGLGDPGGSQGPLVAAGSATRDRKSVV